MRNSEKVAIDIRGIRIWYSKTYETLFCGTYSVPLKLKDGKFNLRVLVDKASIEIYADDGTIMVAIGVILEKAAGSAFKGALLIASTLIPTLERRSVTSAVWKITPIEPVMGPF